MFDFLETLYLAVPAFVANMTPVVVAKLDWLSFLNKPIDADKTFRGKRIFGKNKTVRGFVFGVACATIIALVQFFLAKNNLLPFSFLHNITSSLMFGFLGGFGALAGDAAESFVKRQLGIGSGKPFLPFDQIDYIIGFLLLTSFVFDWTMFQAVSLLIFAALANPLTNLTAYLLGIKKTYW